jgi:signal transduction histidine kinase
LDPERDDETPRLEPLRREIAELRASRRRIVLADDAERRSIERALHAGVQQQLVGLAANLQLAEAAVDVDPTAAKALLVEMGGELGRTIEHARSIASRIHPPLLDTGGLAPALRIAAADAGIRTWIDVPTGAVADQSELARMVYLCCIDVFQRVASGTTVTVTVRADEATTTFEIIVDDSLDAGSLPSRDRVEALGGRLSLVPDADGRIRIVGSVPPAP